MPSPQLVEQIKDLQRSGQKQAWWDYCDQELGGVRDPNRHDDAALKKFLASRGKGGAPSRARPTMPTMSFGGCGGFAPVGPASFGPGMGMGMMAMQPAAGGGDLQSFVKMGQKSSRSFKDGWAMYCQMYGGGLNDPAKHDPTYIVEFINWLGQLAQAELGAHQVSSMMMAPQMMAGPVGGMPGRGAGARRMAQPAMMFGAEPPRKKAKTAAGGGGGGGDAEKANLVEKVKNLQRKDADTKEAWWKFTDEFHGGVHDPNRHEKETLLEFLSNYE